MQSVAVKVFSNDICPESDVTDSIRAAPTTHPI